MSEVLPETGRIYRFGKIEKSRTLQTDSTPEKDTENEKV